MSAAERVAGFFVAPGAASPGAKGDPARDRAQPPMRPGRRRAPAAPVPLRLVPEASPAAQAGLRVCVLGPEVAAARLAWELAGRLARRERSGCALLCGTPAAEGETPVAWSGRSRPATRASRRLARDLAGTGLTATVRGRVVAVTAQHADVAAVVQAHHAPTLTLLTGPRGHGSDSVLSEHHLLVVVVDADAPAALADLAVAELRRQVPNAAVRVVALPSRPGAAVRRGAAVRALEPGP